MIQARPNKNGKVRGTQWPISVRRQEAWRAGFAAGLAGDTHNPYSPAFPDDDMHECWRVGREFGVNAKAAEGGAA